jgi:AcrR family transcriptional regulator
MEAQAVTFQGRKTARQGSEQRRLAILQATLRVIVRDGVRGVRHRAVAAEAEVPLSATTYYFKDIHDLLADAFTLYAQETMDTLVAPFWAETMVWLQSHYTEASVQAHPELLNDIIEHMSEVGTDYIIRRVTVHRERILIEHAFLYAALQDQRLHVLAMQHGQRLAGSLISLLEMARVKDADLAAMAVISLVRRLEYEAAMSTPDRAALKRVLAYQVRIVAHS